MLIMGAIIIHHWQTLWKWLDPAGCAVMFLCAHFAHCLCIDQCCFHCVYLLPHDVFCSVKTWKTYGIAVASLINFGNLFLILRMSHANKRILPRTRAHATSHTISSTEVWCKVAHAWFGLKQYICHLLTLSSILSSQVVSLPLQSVIRRLQTFVQHWTPW